MWPLGQPVHFSLPQALVILAFTAFALGDISATYTVSVLLTSFTALGMCFLSTVPSVLFSIVAKTDVVSYTDFVVHVPPRILLRRPWQLPVCLR